MEEHENENDDDDEYGFNTLINEVYDQQDKQFQKKVHQLMKDGSLPEEAADSTLSRNISLLIKKLLIRMYSEISGTITDLVKSP